MRPVPGGGGPWRPEPGRPGDEERDERASADGEDLGEARRALRRLGGELRETSRSLDGALDVVDRGPDDRRDVADDR